VLAGALGVVFCALPLELLVELPPVEAFGDTCWVVVGVAGACEAWVAGVVLAGGAVVLAGGAVAVAVALVAVSGGGWKTAAAATPGASASASIALMHSHGLSLGLKPRMIDRSSRIAWYRWRE
jgi:hypothetical protein